ncbi:MAG: DUF3298 domain-containing protein [Rhodoplanes sp.]|uniref:DUF3298 and DUF4163 domain-containing protein n=1 Tax=Rhodoplanes sp. TaxID=1968906 RepID=UPI0017FAF7D8|nr:DUF3298 and DUF4163 domain-containing protein [Rhodoplanes sp.]NVO14721.1 DUF3298 domain-containing protein [Rhodoplanes sp.]
MTRTRPTRARTLLSAVVLALLVAATPAAADIVMSAKSKYVAVKVEVDAALRTTPGLFDNLAAEGRKWGEVSRREAEKAYRENPADFSDGRGWFFERNYILLSTAGRYVGVVFTDHVYSGGAHPNTGVDTILWDTTAKKRVSVRPFFTETADNGPTMTALATLIRTAVAKEKKARDADVAADPAKDEWLKAIEPSLLKLGPLVPAPSTEPGKSGGLSIHFSPYAVGSYAEGLYTVVVPWRDFERFLSPEGRTVFGGTPLPPKKDE